MVCVPFGRESVESAAKQFAEKLEIRYQGSPLGVP
jgi:hypothetical protein